MDRAAYRVVLLLTGGTTMPTFGIEMVRSILAQDGVEVCATVVTRQGLRRQRQPLSKRIKRNLTQRGWFTLVVAWYYVLSKVTGRERSWVWVAEREEIDLANLPVGDVHEVEKIHDPSTIELIERYEPDLCFHAGPMILKEPLLSVARHGVLGFHHGDLTQHRGRVSCFWEMYNGESSVGVTTQILAPTLDTGRIVMLKSFEIGSCTSLQEMQRIVNCDSVHMAGESVGILARGNVDLQPPEKLGTYNPVPTLWQFLKFRARMARRRMTERSR